MSGPKGLTWFLLVRVRFQSGFPALVSVAYAHGDELFTVLTMKQGTAQPDVVDSDDDRYITLAEAGATVRKSARWVERHLSVNVNAGAPAVIVIPSIGRSGRAVAKLVSSRAWATWLASFAVTRPVTGPGRPSRPGVPIDLLAPTQRRRLARGF
jgi:hypothetical protein